MNVSEIIKSIKENKAEKHELVFVHEQTGKIYAPVIIRNNEVKQVINQDAYTPENEHLFAKITMGQFAEHLQNNCHQNANVWVDCNIEECKIIQAVDMIEPDNSCFMISPA